jgi:hypothetical protein
MRSGRTRLRTALIGVAIVASVAAVYWAGYYFGYRAGLSDKGPQHRALVVVRRAKGNADSGGSSATWFDIRNAEEAAKLAKEEQRLKAIGADYYVAKGITEITLSPEPDPRRVNSHR